MSHIASFDERIGVLFETGNLEGLFEFDEDFCEAAAECGLRSFQIMAGALDGLPVRSRLLSNEGPFGVGYGVALLEIGDDAERTGSDIDPCVRLARLSVETFVKTGKPAKLPSDVPEALLSSRAGAFVSLHEHGELRGCIGTISATTENIAREILQKMGVEIALQSAPGQGSEFSFVIGKEKA